MSRDLPMTVEESLERIAVVLDDIASALEKLASKKAVVPMFIFIPATNMRQDELTRLSAFLRSEWAKMSGDPIQIDELANIPDPRDPE